MGQQSSTNNKLIDDYVVCGTKSDSTKSDETKHEPHIFEFRPFYKSHTSSCTKCGVQPIDYNIVLASLVNSNNHHVHVHVWDDGECIASMPGKQGIPICGMKREDTKKNYEIFKKTKKEIIQYVPDNEMLNLYDTNLFDGK